MTHSTHLLPVMGYINCHALFHSRENWYLDHQFTDEIMVIELGEQKMESKIDIPVKQVPEVLR
jgi:hypothetical protein